MQREVHENPARLRRAVIKCGHIALCMARRQCHFAPQRWHLQRLAQAGQFRAGLCIRLQRIAVLPGEDHKVRPRL